MTPTVSSLLLTLANAAPPAGAPGGGTAAPGWFGALYQIGFIVLLFGAMYMILIAPQRRKQKETRRMIESVQKGARVTTIGGIHGTVISVDADTVVLKVDETSNAKIRFQKAAIAGVEQQKSE